MATQRRQRQCFYCEKENVTYECNGCIKYFCLEHLNKHHTEHIEQLDIVANERNFIHELLLEKREDIEKHRLFEKIDQWEKKSIEIIIQMSDDLRQTLTKHLKESLNSIEMQLKNFVTRLDQIRIQNQFNEIQINQFNTILNQLKEQIEHPLDIEIKENSSNSIINKISIINPNCMFFINITNECTFI